MVSLIWIKALIFWLSVLIDDAVDQSAAIICVTHDEMILDRFDRILRLRDGRLEPERGVDRGSSMGNVAIGKPRGTDVRVSASVRWAALKF